MNQFIGNQKKQFATTFFNSLIERICLKTENPQNNIFGSKTCISKLGNIGGCKSAFLFIVSLVGCIMFLFNSDPVAKVRVHNVSRFFRVFSF